MIWYMIQKIQSWLHKKIIFNLSCFTKYSINLPLFYPLFDCFFKEIIVARAFMVVKELFINSTLLFIVDFSKTLPTFFNRS